MVATFAIAIPYLPYAGALGFVRLPLPILAGVLRITALYVLGTELLKVAFYRAPRPSLG